MHQAVLSEKEAQGNMLEEYEEIKAEYAMYAAQGLPTEQQGTISRTAMQDILEQTILPVSRVRGLAIAGNLMSLELVEIFLQTATNVVDRLELAPAKDADDGAAINAGAVDLSAERISFEMK